MIAYESGATDTVDPFAGSYYVEALTAEIEQRAWALIEKVDEQGGSVDAIAFIKNEIEESAFGYHERYRVKQDVVVGVNEMVEDSAEVEEILSVDPESEREQLERLKAFKQNRDQELTDSNGSTELKQAAEGTDNLLPPIRQALKDSASVGEVCGALRAVFGDYQPEHLGRAHRSSTCSQPTLNRKSDGPRRSIRLSTPPRLLACVKTRTALADRERVAAHLEGQHRPEAGVVDRADRRMR